MSESQTPLSTAGPDGAGKAAEEAPGKSTAAADAPPPRPKVAPSCRSRRCCATSSSC
ncbi:hypothetical protein [Blastococcus brunescens]|uniref:Uncharacterized protein n=1 Tax=Blastococcus brunescens TaxID=1564165 RepID=A0ABZ1B0Q7_9ACTN|nr:hypothetical protein [Blastococcus sp. BMG 8361]WRL64395.1 hypothetical protein U6N30_00595 [Blastococcus sp. BMG 8361]